MDIHPLTNLIAIIHLCFVFGLIGCYMTEGVIEYYSIFFDNKLINE